MPGGAEPLQHLADRALLAAAPTDDAVQTTVARVKTIGDRAAIIEAITGMGFVDSAMRTAMLEASKTLPPDQRDAAQKAANSALGLEELVPAAIAVRYALPESKTSHLIIFVLAYLAMIPCANLIGFAGQELARKVPHVWGVLIETTYGPYYGCQGVP